MAEFVIIGVGNPYRGDDAVGWFVVDKLLERGKYPFELLKISGDLVEMIDLFTRYRSIYLIDACLSEDSLGKWCRIDAIENPIFKSESLTSTHGFGISQAVSMARNLDMLPGKIIVYAINGDRFHMEEGLSPLVEKCVDEVVEAILKEEEIISCMNKV